MSEGRDSGASVFTILGGTCASIFCVGALVAGALVLTWGSTLAARAEQERANREVRAEDDVAVEALRARLVAESLLDAARVEVREAAAGGDEPRETLVRVLGQRRLEGGDIGAATLERLPGGGWQVACWARILEPDFTSTGDVAVVLAEHRLIATLSADGSRVEVGTSGPEDPPEGGVLMMDPMGLGPR